MSITREQFTWRRIMKSRLYVASALGILAFLAATGLSQEPAPQTLEEVYRHGIVAMKSKDYKQALADFNEVIFREPRHLGAYVGRTNCYAEQKDIKNTISSLRATVKVGPVDKVPFAYNTLAVLLSASLDPELRDGPKAVELATLLCEFSQWKNPTHLETLAMAYAETGDFEGAKKWQTKVVDLRRAGGLIDEAKNAQETLSQYESKKPIRDLSQYQSLLREALKLGREKHYDQAIPKLTEAIRLYPDDCVLFEVRGSYYYVTGKDEFAINDLNEVARRKPPEDAFGSYQDLAALLSTSSDAKLRDGRRAVEITTKLCELTKWEQPNALQSLAIACAEAGDFEAALRWQNKAVELAETNPQKGWSSASAEMLLKLFGEKKPFRYDAR